MAAEGGPLSRHSEAPCEKDSILSIFMVTDTFNIGGEGKIMLIEFVKLF